METITEGKRLSQEKFFEISSDFNPRWIW